MKQHLFAILFFTVLPLVLPVPRRYILIQEGKTWSDAQTFCRDKYTDLATIDNNDDMINLQEEAQSHQFSSTAWIGLYTNINRWYWSFNNELLGSFASWYPGVPNNENRNEECVAVVVNDKWGDVSCDEPFPFVCVDDTRTGADRYILITEAQTWFDAQSFCRQHYTDLASITDATENSAVAALKPSGYMWFGLTRDPWKWSDQSTDVSLVQWSGGDANDYSMNKSCGFFSNGMMDAAQCSDIKPFFCYSFPDRQQIIRVKVSSSQDVNDPAVMVAILEKIKQKLEDRGLSGNVTVKWRKQSDGLVFHKEKDTRTGEKSRGSCDLR